MAEDRPIRDRKKREFLPTDPKAEGESFGSANEWGRKQLKMLDVGFTPNAKKRLDLYKIFLRERWPPEIEQRTNPQFWN